MPANLSPEYKNAEQQFRAATTPEEVVAALEEMLRTIPKHKGTEKMQADLKRRLAKARKEVQQSGKKGGHKPHFHVDKTGAGQVVLVGPPNAGKSRLLAAATHAHPEVAEYPFTTQLPLPGMLPWHDAQIQLVDLPAVVRDLTDPWVLGLVRNADAVLLVLDASSDDVLADCEDLLAHLEERNIHLVRPETVEVHDGEGVGATRRALIAATKMDLPPAADNLELLAELVADRLPLLPVSGETGEGLDRLADAVWGALHVIRIYTKAPGRPAEQKAPYVLPEDCTVLDVARHVHADFAEHLRFARIWGTGRYDGQMVGREDVLADADLLELHL